MLFLFAIPSLPRLFRARGLFNQYHADATGVYAPGSQSERDFWRTVENNRAEDLNHIHGKQKIPQASVSTSLGWRLDHGGGPFEDAVSRALDSAFSASIRGTGPSVFVIT